jgi:hypothetical protein
MLVFLEIVLAAIWNYEQRFFLLLILVFFFCRAGAPPSGSGPPDDGSCLGQALSRGLRTFSKIAATVSGIPLSTFLYHRGSGFMLSIVIRARRLVQGI